MGIPQITIIALVSIGIGTALAKNGEPKEGKYSFGISILGAAIELGILYWGGFFG